MTNTTHARCKVKGSYEDYTHTFADIFRNTISEFTSREKKMGTELAPMICCAATTGEFLDPATGQHLEYKLIIGRPGFDDAPPQGEDE